MLKYHPQAKKWIIARNSGIYAAAAAMSSWTEIKSVAYDVRGVNTPTIAGDTGAGFTAATFYTTGANATNTNAAVRYLQLHDKATIPLAGETAQQNWIIPAGTATTPGYVEFEFKYGAAFATGIGFAISTVVTTYTAATASEHTVHVEYR